MEFKSDIDVKTIQTAGGDHMVVAAAKVSVSGIDAIQYSQESCADENAGLIHFLMKHRHGTPFEHSSMTFFVHAPIFVWREWHRHRIGFSYNEESGRYKTLEPVFYIPDRDRPMIKVDGWKPGRPKFERLPHTNEGASSYHRFVEMKKRQYKSAYESYQAALALGIDPGLARIDLPVGIYSGCWVTCNPRSLMSFLSLRVHDPNAAFVSYPLWEINVAANACEKVLRSLWPITHAAFVKNGRVSP